MVKVLEGVPEMLKLRCIGDYEPYIAHQLGNNKYKRLRIDISYILLKLGYAPLKGIDKRKSPRSGVVDMMRDCSLSHSVGNSKIESLNYKKLKMDVKEDFDKTKNSGERVSQELGGLIKTVENIDKLEAEGQERKLCGVKSFFKNHVKNEYKIYKSYDEEYPSFFKYEESKDCKKEFNYLTMKSDVVRDSYRKALQIQPDSERLNMLLQVGRMNRSGLKEVSSIIERKLVLTPYERMSQEANKIGSRGAYNNILNHLDKSAFKEKLFKKLKKKEGIEMFDPKNKPKEKAVEKLFRDKMKEQLREIGRSWTNKFEVLKEMKEELSSSPATKILNEKEIITLKAKHNEILLQKEIELNEKCPKDNMGIIKRKTKKGKEGKMEGREIHVESSEELTKLNPRKYKVSETKYIFVCHLNKSKVVKEKERAFQNKTKKKKKKTPKVISPKIQNLLNKAPKSLAVKDNIELRKLKINNSSVENGYLSFLLSVRKYLSGVRSISETKNLGLTMGNEEGDYDFLKQFRLDYKRRVMEKSFTLMERND